MRKLHITQVATDTARRAANDRGQDAAATIEEAQALAPWAAELVQVDGGWVAYESVEDARVARQQA